MSQAGDFREPTALERELIATLLRPEFPGRDVLVKQLESAQVKTLDADSSLTIAARIDERAEVVQRVVVEAWATDTDGMLIEFLLHVIDGRLDEFEVFRADSKPLQHVVQPGELDVFVSPNRGDDAVIQTPREVPPEPVVNLREIAVTLDRDDVVALGEARERVHVVALQPPGHVATFDTILDFGGKRLAMCSVGERLVVVAAAWERDGICGYDALTGARLWQRKDLKRTQRLSPAGKGELVAASLEGQALQVLDAATGETKASIRSAASFWQSPLAPVAVTGWNREIALIDTVSWERRWRGPIEGFAVLDAAFGSDFLAVSDAHTAHGSIYCFGLDGQLVWRHEEAPETLCWALGWDGERREWLGLEHHVNKKAPDLLSRWSSTGAPISQEEVESVGGGAAFLLGGRTLVTQSGNVVDTRTGATTVLRLHAAVG
jgi:hypothetical protein